MEAHAFNGTSSHPINIALTTMQQDIDESGFKDFYTWFVSKKTHREQSLFFQAYQSVTDTPQGWWYSCKKSKMQKLTSQPKFYSLYLV